MMTGYDMWLGVAAALSVSIAVAACLVWALIAQRPTPNPNVRG